MTVCVRVRAEMSAGLALEKGNDGLSAGNLESPVLQELSRMCIFQRGMVDAYINWMRALHRQYSRQLR